MTISTFFSDLGDGYVYSNSIVYSTACSGNAMSTNTDATLSIQQRLNGSRYDLYQSFVDWDTSAIGAGDDISAAVLSLYGTASVIETRSFVAQARLYDWGGSLTPDDWIPCNLLSGKALLATIASGSWSTSAYNAFTDVALPANVSKTGTTSITLVQDLMVAESAPSGHDAVYAFPADEAGTTKDPKLVVTHEPSEVSATITGVTATAPAAGLAGAVQIATSIGGIEATAPAAGLPGVVTSDQGVSVTGVLATAPGDGLAGVAQAQVQVSITGALGTAPAVGLAGSADTVKIVSVGGALGAAPAEGLIGVVAAQQQTSIAGTVGAAPADGLIGVIPQKLIVALYEGSTHIASGQFDALTGSFVEYSFTLTTAERQAVSNWSNLEIRLIGSGTESNTIDVATVRIDAPTGVPLPSASIAGVTATADADGLSGVVETQVSISIAGITAAASAAGLAGTATTVASVTILGIIATAAALGLAGEWRHIGVRGIVRPPAGSSVAQLPPASGSGVSRPAPPAGTSLPKLKPPGGSG